MFRAARRYHGLSLREVERRTGRTNAYLSQVERGVIRRPDPLVVLELAALYELNLGLVAQWAGLDQSGGDEPGPPLRDLVRAVLELGPARRADALRYIEELLRTERT